jgi:hypothetical protein
MGGYIAADSKIVDVIRSYAPGFIFTTSLSPVLVAGVLASEKHLKSSSVEREGQQAAAAMLKRLFADAGLPVMPSTTHIVPLMVGDPVKAKKISDILLAEYGVYVQPINFPTVPRGTERLRFLPVRPTEAMMRELTDALVEIWGRSLNLDWRPDRQFIWPRPKSRMVSFAAVIPRQTNLPTDGRMGEWPARTRLRRNQTCCKEKASCSLPLPAENQRARQRHQQKTLAKAAAPRPQPSQKAAPR